MQEEFEFVRLVGNERRAGSKLADVSRHWQDAEERFLMISPHDDDAVLGAGLLIQLAKRENVPVHIMIVTDGSMGYCSIDEKDSIAEIRRNETFECYQSLGVPKENIVWLGFADCQLSNHRGRSAAKPDDPEAIEGFTGLQNAFTYHLRKIKPTQCFLPTSNDLHPDHRIIYDEFLISLFHAAGNIWPELGKPLEKVPYVHTFAVYCDFAAPPTLRMRTPISYLENKLDAIAAFRSQKQISSLIENVRHCGPEEYTRAIDFRLYRPASYRDRFEEKEAIRMVR
ncbi:MAG: GlcNAc-PI de-N-acetylase [Planctomycetes bacterium B3_Pla]|nr:MAG: GlcNAc-PI de-N-acetylase [Planctomycetes bacterium B3_Pla]